MFESIALPLIIGLAGSFCIEQALTPKPVFLRQRSVKNYLLHCGIWLTCFTVLMLLLQRPWFVICLIFALQGLLVAVNQAKYDSLREAFIYQDFEYFTDAIKHPRLYLPFFGIGKTVAAILAFIIIFSSGLWLEPALENRFGWALFGQALGLCFLISISCLVLGNSPSPETTFSPNEDLYKFGQLAFFWHYWQEENNHKKISTKKCLLNFSANLSEPEKKPDIIAVQSESFFDPRSMCSSINPAVLQHFDQVKSESLLKGRVKVPAWGANTVRTECGFLTGLTPDEMGIHQFNPYRILAKQGIPNLADFFKKMGYKTICIHPYPITFYQRDRVYPLMGFDDFIDIQFFSESEKNGQYISDAAVTQKIIQILDVNEKKPVFIFVITMENHGPLHLEKLDNEDFKKFYTQTPKEKLSDLTVYLSHLKNADQMINNLKEKLQHRHEHFKNEGILCWYGDHVPIMSDVYQELGEPDGLTDYFIWKTGDKFAIPRNPSEKAINISSLGKELLKCAGVI